jgi:hypothetical protein
MKMKKNKTSKTEEKLSHYARQFFFPSSLTPTTKSTPPRFALLFHPSPSYCNERKRWN